MRNGEREDFLGLQKTFAVEPLTHMATGAHATFEREAKSFPASSLVVR